MTWILLTYKVPPEPAARRVALWRKLKSMGAVYLQNGVCLLPETSESPRFYRRPVASFYATISSTSRCA
ncbi:Chromate resistance protein ChrB [Sulfitobacter pontiacus]|uniref:Chromate resistance protein ChrB n=1 Tax=Sulfitobacter pontiacus TaxID=60137 RepID=UPI003BF47361